MEHVVNTISACVWLFSILLWKIDINFFLAADTICSCTEAVDELFQHTLGHECLEQDVNTFSICVYMFIAYSDLKIADFHNFLQILSAAALKLLTSSSSTPWVMNAWNRILILIIYVHICLLPIPLWKEQIFIILASDTNCSCIEDNQCVLKWSF